MTKKITHSEIVEEIPKIRTDKSGPLEYPKYIPPPGKIVQDIEDRYNSYSIWEIIWFLITRPAKVIMLIYRILKLIEKVQKMAEKKSKTSVAVTVKVLLGVVAAIAGIFGADLPAGFQESITGIAIGGYFLFSWIQGIFTKDKDETKKDVE